MLREDKKKERLAGMRINAGTVLRFNALVKALDDWKLFFYRSAPITAHGY